MNDEQGSRAYRRKLSTPEAAAYIGLGESTLNKSRVTKSVGSTPAPPYIKLGARVLYDPADLDQWLAQNKRRSTSDVKRWSEHDGPSLEEQAPAARSDGRDSGSEAGSCPTAGKR